MELSKVGEIGVKSGPIMAAADIFEIDILSNKQVEISKHFARNHPDWGKVPFILSLLKIFNFNQPDLLTI